MHNTFGTIKAKRYTIHDHTAKTPLIILLRNFIILFYMGQVAVWLSGSVLVVGFD